MYRLLIVDDEPIITDGIFELFDAMKEEDIDLCKAYSGDEALTIAQNSRIDILLTDISMPDITGLELQKQIHDLWPNSKTIFLTGYHDFAFIQEAIRNDSIDYILKTEGDERIIAAYRKAIQKIEDEFQLAQELQIAKEDHMSLRKYLAGKMFVDMISGGYYSANDRLCLFSRLEIPMSPNKPFIILLGRTGIKSEQRSFVEKIEVLEQIQVMTRSLFPPHTNVYSVTLDNQDILWLIQTDEHITEKGQELLQFYVHENMDRIGDACRGSFQLPLALVSAQKSLTWDELPEKVEKLQLLLLHNTEISGNAWIIESETKEILSDDKWPRAENLHLSQGHHLHMLNDDPDETIENINDRTFFRDAMKQVPLMKSLLESGQKDEFLRLLEVVLRNYQKITEKFHYFLKELYYSISVMLLTYINEMGFFEILSESTDMDPLTDMSKHQSWKDLVDYLYTVVERVFEINANRGFTDTNRILQFVRNYIVTNISGDLSLSTVSKLLHFNSSYFSRLFKSITEMGYSEYVSKMKISMAKEMLTNGEMSIHKIGNLLGFESSSSFTRFFKKQTTFNPMDYKSENHIL